MAQGKSRAYIYREEFPWSKTDGFTDGQGKYGFFERAGHKRRLRYYTPQRMARRLRQVWRPVSTTYWVTDDFGKLLRQLEAMKPL